MEPRRNLIGCCIALAALAAGAWVYSQIQAVNGRYWTEFTSTDFSRNSITVSLGEGALRVSKFVIPLHTAYEYDSPVTNIPYLAQIQHTDVTFVSNQGSSVPVRGYISWWAHIELTGLFVLASIYPAIVVRRYRLLMLAFGLATAAYATYRVGAIFYWAYDNALFSWERDFTDAFTDLLVIAVLTAALFACNGISKRPNQDHLCKTCGYNLTGNVSGICPECGRKWHYVQPQDYGKTPAGIR